MVFTSAGRASVVSLPGYGATRNAIQTRKPTKEKRSSGAERDEKRALLLTAALRDRAITAVGKILLLNSRGTPYYILNTRDRPVI